ncbi:YbfB/YjiJ family MFS transporter [Chitinasiproducens palmae]|uniref:Uncharacterized MFS-type transporter YbfB n=1 Tax=Chitinasiproducens palmae TaxID=1770053 RepID=A0A1H2PQM9_9BURK|nr:YbfB/YjiJ family MFS transporter [Chitinasiproducens palmae]SDV48721.1 Uncharacterised MFS-type transporter YbfB [Chitinasiproducens palmae]
MTSSIRTAGLRAAAEAALILAVGMGFGRFAFTAVLPHMVEEGVITLQQGSLAASANYAGYLLGAFVAVRARARHAHRLCLWSVVATALCLAVLALPLPTWGIVAVRGIAGALSAMSMVAASLWLLEHRGHFRGAPLLYAGVGIGIALSAETLVLAAHAGLHSSGMWLVLGIASLVVGLAAAPGLLASADRPAAVPDAPASTAQAQIAAWPLTVVYGLAGLGYIVTATYLPTLVHSALPGLDPAHVWAVFGLGAVPSCFVWHRVHERLGTRRAMQLNLLVQAVGVALPTLSGSVASYVLSALLVGGTFTGAVTIAVPAAQRVARRTGKNLVATLTLFYGIGQIAGPVLVEVLRAHGNGLSSSLLAATAVLLVAALLASRI